MAAPVGTFPTGIESVDDVVAGEEVELLANVAWLVAEGMVGRGDVMRLEDAVLVVEIAEVDAPDTLAGVVVAQ